MNHAEYLAEQRQAIRDRLGAMYPLDVRPNEPATYIPDRDMARTFAEIEDAGRTAEYLVNYHAHAPTIPEQYIIRVWDGEPATRLRGLYNAMDAAYREYVEKCYYDRI